jgi:uncharacterized phiE125 gp8 family phage protein
MPARRGEAKDNRPALSGLFHFHPMPNRTTPPATEPISLAEAKLHLRVDHADEDGLIGALIAVARQAAEDRLQRTLITSTWQQVLDGFPACSASIALSMPPVIGVSSLQYRDADGTLQTLDAAAYQVATHHEPAQLLPVGAWPATQAGRVGTVTVTYTAGYGATAASVPGPIKQWLLLAIGDMYERRIRSAERPAVPQGFADGLLDTYRVWSL